MNRGESERCEGCFVLIGSDAGSAQYCPYCNQICNMLDVISSLHKIQNGIT